MIDISNMRTYIVTGLSEYLGVPVIRANQSKEPPHYPYITYTVTTLASENNGTWGQWEDNKDRNAVTQTWSINSLSDNDAESAENAIKAREWLQHIGTYYLNANNIIVQSATSITNRDNVLTVGYEYKNGFDVVFWLYDEVDTTVGANGFIETAALNETD